MLREMSLTVALLFISCGALANAQSEPEPGAGFAEAGAAQVYYDVNRNLSLHCPLANADKARQYVWKKDDKPLEEVAGLKDRYTLEEGGALFRVKGKAHEDDYGNYTCEADGEQSQFQVRGKPFARLPDNTNVVENQNIKLQCKVIGKPSPSVWWTYSAEMPEENAKFNRSEALSSQGRFKLAPNEQGVEDAVLEIAAAERADAGVYVCHADAGAHAHRDHTTLRVKDMYAALWPFLGICAEVFVLCAIILVYEKRRTKPELDDSDTDNHDQKKS